MLTFMSQWHNYTLTQASLAFTLKRKKREKKKKRDWGWSFPCFNEKMPHILQDIVLHALSCHKEWAEISISKTLHGWAYGSCRSPFAVETAGVKFWLHGNKQKNDVRSLPWDSLDGLIPIIDASNYLAVCQVNRVVPLQQSFRGRLGKIIHYHLHGNCFKKNSIWG